MLNLDDPRYRPLWLRVALTTVCLLWGAVEVFTGSPGWGMGFLALGLWVGWRFFITYDPERRDR